MNILKTTIFASASALALASAARAQQAPTTAVNEIVVTGSRIITNGNNSPTPVTVMSAQSLQETTPTTIADALVKLPEFAGGSPSVTSIGNPSNNAASATLNLRGFGVIRTLILEDGRRVPPTALGGTVDNNLIPDMLMSRVDVVTGGASAVYGSDAVAGVVNYILDHNYNGLKLNVQGGESTFRDHGSYKVGIAAGRSFMDGRLHVEGSYEHYSSDGVPKTARTNTSRVYCNTGSGTAANPYVVGVNCTYPLASAGGVILSGAGKGLNFTGVGALTPFVNGQATGTANEQIGGDGVQGELNTTAIQPLKYDQGFGRIDYDFGSGVHGFVQGNWGNEFNASGYQSFGLNPLTFSTNNPFLTAAEVAQLGGPNQTFSMGKFYFNAPTTGESADTTTYSITAGLSGKFASKYNWNLFYTHSDTTLVETGTDNYNIDKVAAAMDAVRDPATGQTVCSVTLTNPGLYPGCVPINPFGPTSGGAMTGMTWALQNTPYTANNYLDDAGGTISGSLWDLPAGPVSAALSGEYRAEKLTNATDYSALQLQNCTGLRYNCSPTAQIWYANPSIPVTASEGIWEVGLETNIPLLKDMAWAKTLEINGAVRYADYSVSGGALTWKVGGVWRPTDDFTIRVTRSQDIRAPTLYELFQPQLASLTGFNDTHTGATAEPNGSAETTVSKGNPNLVPEVAQTWTAGVVFRPGALPGFSVSVDYYNVSIGNALSSVSGGTYDAICDASGGASPFCSLLIRPLPFSNTTPANYPTEILSSTLNIAQQYISGVDVEANYGLPLADLYKPLPGLLSLRALVNYQPDAVSVAFAGQQAFNGSGTAAGIGGIGAPTWKLVFMAAYSVGPWKIDVQERWRSSLKLNANPAIVYVGTTSVPSTEYTDLTVSRDFMLDQHKVTGFVTVDNLLNEQPPIYTGLSGATTDFRSNTSTYDDIIGTYITIGARFVF